MSRFVPLILLASASSLAAQRTADPIIDMHLHADAADANGPPPLALCAPPMGYALFDPRESWPETFTSSMKKPPCPNPIWGPTTDDSVMMLSLEILKRRNIYAVTSGPLIARWDSAGGDRILPALNFSFGQKAVPTPDQVRELLHARRYVAFAEVAIQYDGVSPSDERFDPYLAVAEQLDVPVGIHIGTGPPGAPYLGAPNYRARLHSPLLLEDALVRHPKLRVYIMHAGWPMLDDLLVMLWTYPQLYVDTGAISFALPRAEFHHYLQRIVAAGFGKRVMFGSDQMNWPAAIERAIEGIESATFLSPGQKRDILYNNAARFLRLSDKDIAKHHGRG
jgi:hypothetical protein